MTHAAWGCEAEGRLRSAIAVNPQHMEAQHVLGLCLQVLPPYLYPLCLQVLPPYLYPYSCPYWRPQVLGLG